MIWEVDYLTREPHFNTVRAAGTGGPAIDSLCDLARQRIRKWGKNQGIIKSKIWLLNSG